MSDDSLIDRLSRFTPQAAGLDREALLFAAGRASARSGRTWMALAGVLTVTQTFTLALALWPRALPSASVPVQQPTALVEPVEEPPPAPELRSLREHALASEGLLPEPSPGEEVGPAETPLRAFGAFSSDLLK